MRKRKMKWKRNSNLMFQKRLFRLIKKLLLLRKNQSRLKKLR